MEESGNKLDVSYIDLDITVCAVASWSESKNENMSVLKMSYAPVSPLNLQ